MSFCVTLPKQSLKVRIHQLLYFFRHLAHLRACEVVLSSYMFSPVVIDKNCCKNESFKTTDMYYQKENVTVFLD